MPQSPDCYRCDPQAGVTCYVHVIRGPHWKLPEQREGDF